MPRKRCAIGMEEGGPFFLSPLKPLPHHSRLPLNVSRLRNLHTNLGLNCSVGSLWEEIFTHIILGVQTGFQQQAHGSVGFPLGDFLFHTLGHKLRSGIIGNTLK